MTKPVDNALARSLLSRCAEQDERALAELHRILAPRIYAFSFHRLRDEEAAQTIVIDTMYEVWKSAGKFRGDSLVTTWVFGIARYKMMALQRQVGPEHEDIVDYEDVLPSDAEDGPAAMMRWQDEQIVRQCMNDLSPTHRECLQLVYFEGLGVADVAKVQNTYEGTVKTRLMHARKKMRACVEENGR
ncbi:MAG TPA: sigma-70 family RNA polymerase sigma factor [Burkholderiaceae bacterium]|nr:sigma-70 family RNA polymerase sigma factor [Burkholderiaceae bacterium]